MKRNWPAMALVGAAFAALGIYFGAQRGPDRPSADPVARLFSSNLPDAQGVVHELGQWKGKTVLVNFWATWCAPCVEEMPELAALQAEIAPRGAQIIGISIDSAANVVQFAAKYKISYPLYIAGMGNTDLLHAFGNQAGGLPFSVLIEPNGKIKQTYLGRLKLDQLQRDLNDTLLP
jgi:peroxiredoxin